MKYLLTFAPLKHFFFGNERTFREDYVAVSEYFPQPTQLLGALRLFIAEQNGLMKQYMKGRFPKDPKRLAEFVGSAKAHDYMHNDDLGKIRNLSRMFIVTDSLDDALFPTPFDVDIAPLSVGSEEAKLGYCTLSHIGGSAYVEGYDVKRHRPQRLGGREFWRAYIEGRETCLASGEPYDYDGESARGVFVEHRQVGIGLEHKQTIDKAFYAKCDYTLAKGFRFAALVEYDGTLEEGIMQIGAESSLFRVKVHPFEETALIDHPVVTRLFTPLRSGSRLVAVSDVMLQKRDDLHARFAIVPYVKRFAMIRTEKGRYRGTHGMRQVMPAGSVAFMEEGALPSFNIGAYAKMGYNQFITIP